MSTAYRTPDEGPAPITVQRTEPAEFPFASVGDFGPFHAAYWSWVVNDSREGVALFLDFGLSARIGSARPMNLAEARAQRDALDHAIKQAEKFAR